MKKIMFLLFSTISIVLFIYFIFTIHSKNVKPEFSFLKNNDIDYLEKNEILYYGSTTCQACQEYNKVLKRYQEESNTKIYYWDAKKMEIINEAAKIKVYNTPTVIIKRDNVIKTLEGYQSLADLKHFIKNGE